MSETMQNSQLNHVMAIKRRIIIIDSTITSMGARLYLTWNSSAIAPSQSSPWHLSRRAHEGCVSTSYAIQKDRVRQSQGWKASYGREPARKRASLHVGISISIPASSRGHCHGTYCSITNHFRENEIVYHMCRSSYRDQESSVAGDPWALLEDFTKAEFTGRAQSTYLSSKGSRQQLREAFLYACQTPESRYGWQPCVHESGGSVTQGSGHGAMMEGRDDDAQGMTTEPKGIHTHSPILVGILSSDIRLAMRSLRDYSKALGAPFLPPTPQGALEGVSGVPAIQGPVYIRYRWFSSSSLENQCTVTRYTGNNRGVLVQFGTLQIGHLPLGLLDEDMKNASPIEENCG